MTGRQRPLRQRLGALACSAAVSAALLAACTVRTESEPRVIAADDVPGSLLENTTTTTSLPDPAPDATAIDRTFYLISRSEAEGTQVVPVQREVDADLPPAEIIEALFALQVDEADPGEADLTNATRGLEVIDAERLSIGDEVVLDLDLAPSIQELQGPEARNAFAQIVYTATQIAGVDAVRFKAGGEVIQPFIGEGVIPEDETVMVDRSDYRELRPTPS